MTKRRWLKSILIASQEQQPAMPFQRGNRSKPSSLKTGAPVQPLPRSNAASR